MTRFLAALILSAAALPAQAATCLLHVNGITYFDGPCQFLPQGGDGSFRVVGTDGWSAAELSVLEPGVAQGWWNGGDGSAGAGAPLGTLYRDIRDPACWVNGTATICAW